jgi:uncharacterized delta-60 repeat protein
MLHIGLYHEYFSRYTGILSRHIPIAVILISIFGSTTPNGSQPIVEAHSSNLSINNVAQLTDVTLLPGQITNDDVTGQISSNTFDSKQLAGLDLEHPFFFVSGGADIDYVNSMAQTYDGGYILVGSTLSFGAGMSDILLLKYNQDGLLSWAKTVGGSGNDFAMAVTRSHDLGYIVAGKTNSFGAGNFDVILMRFSSDGTLTWARTAGGNAYESGESITQAQYGGYLVSGTTSSFGAGNGDVLLLYYDTDGTLIWSGTAGGGDDEYVSSVIWTNDGGYLVAGSTKSYGEGSYEVLLIKYTASFEITWAVTTGGSGADIAKMVVQTSDYGYIVTGVTTSFGVSDDDGLLLKYTVNGTLSWARTVGGIYSDWAESVAQTSNGDYIVTGWTSSYGAGSTDILLLRYASDGSLNWARTVGGHDEEYSYSIFETVEGSIILAGHLYSFGAGESDAFLIKTNSRGMIDNCPACVGAAVVVSNPSPLTSSQVLTTSSPFLFTSSPVPDTTTPDPQNTMICGTGHFLVASGGANSEHADSVVQTEDGGYIVAGRTDSYGFGNDDILLMKYARDGSLLWAKTAGGSLDDFAYSVAQVDDGGYIVAGVTYSFGAGNSDVLLLKFDRHGTLSWARTAGGSGYDYASAVIETTDGNYILAGATNSFDASFVVFLLEYSPDGTFSWAHRLPGIPASEAQAIAQTADGGYIIAGFTQHHSAGSNDVMLLKYPEDWSNGWALAAGGISEDRAYAVAETTDHGYIVAGYTQSGGAGGADILLLKFTGNGALDWARAIGGSLNDWAFTVAKTANGGNIVAGFTFNYGAGDYDALLLDYAGNGTLNWARTAGGGSADRAHSLAMTVDGGFILAGRTESFGAGNSDVLVYKSDANGEIANCPLCQPVSPTTSVLAPGVNYFSDDAYGMNASVTESSPIPSTASPSPESILVCDGFYHTYLPLVVR